MTSITPIAYRTAVNEYQYCVQKTGDMNHHLCMQRRRDWVELCPIEWIENFADQIDEGTFMGVGSTLGLEEDEEFVESLPEGDDEEVAEEEDAGEEEAEEEE